MTLDIMCPVPGVLLIWIVVGQEPIVQAAHEGWRCLDIFFSSCLSFL